MKMSEKMIKLILIFMLLLALAVLIIPFTAEAQTQIYRSVGGSQAIATGSGSNTLTISGSTATFSANMPERFGVGQSIEFDSLGLNTTRNAIVFVHARLTTKTFTVKRANGAAPPTVSAATMWSAFFTYTSLSNWEAGTENTNIGATVRNFDTGDKDIATANEVWNVACQNTSPTYNEGLPDASTDATALSISGWTTSATNYIRIYAPYLNTEVGDGKRHAGQYSFLYYNIGISSASNTITIASPADHVRIEGIQISHTGTGSSARSCLSMTNLSSSCDIRISNCIFKGANATTADTTSGIDVLATSNTGTYYVSNCVFYNFDGDQTYRNGVTFRPSGGSSGTLYIYNNTFFRCRNGIERKYSGTVIAKNNLYQSNSLASADGFKGTFDGASNYNLSDIASDAPGANSKNSTSVSFYLTGDFEPNLHLLSTDTGAKDSGTDLSADGNLAITNDYERDTRSGTFDIGADEYVNPATKVKKIYRSIQNVTSALKSGAGNNLTIADSTATFASALPDTIGIGDALQYDSDNNGSVDAICFISYRYSSTRYMVKNRIGLTPTATSSADQDWGVYRAYTAIGTGGASGFTGSVENTGIDNAVEDFDISSRDLAANNEQMNAVIYRRTSSENSLATIYFHTSADCYLRIFAPSCTTEVGTSYRHSGVYSATKAGFSGSSAFITLQPDNAGTSRSERSLYVRIDGLQFNNTNSVSTTALKVLRQLGSAWASDIRIESCIFVSATMTSGTGTHCAVELDCQTASSTLSKILVANNLMYGWRSTGGTPFYEGAVVTGTTGTGGKYYIYNNTMYDCEIGIDRNVGTVVAINNIYDGHQLAQDGFQGTFDASSNYNISNLTSDAPGANSQNLTVVAFVDSTNNDFHLAGGDVIAQNAGTNLSADSDYPITNDVDYATRTGTWDVGADDPSATASTCATLYPAAASSNNRRRAIIQ